MLFSRNELKPLLHQVSTNDPELTSLHLSHKKITNKQLLQISDALKTNTHITEIWLTNNHITDESGGGGSGSDGGNSGAVGYLTSVLETNRSVGEVYLGGNKIGAKGASSIAALLQKNHIITDIGLDSNLLDDTSAKMLLDALTTNPTLQTLKLEGNDGISSTETLKQIQEKLKGNKAEAKKKFEEEHPDMVTHKLKKPEKEKKKSKKSSSRDKDGKRRSGSGGDKDRKKSGEKDSERRRKESSSSSSKGRSSGEKKSSSSSGKDKSSKDKASTENSDAFLAERKKSMEESKQTTMKDKFKGLGLAGLGGKDNVDEISGAEGIKKGGMKSAAFV